MDAAVQKDKGKSLRKGTLNRLHVDVRGHHNERIHAAAHRFQSRGNLLPAAVRTGDEEVISVLLRCFICAANDFREEFSKQIRKDEADGFRPLAAQAPSDGIGDILQGNRCGMNARTSVLFHYV